MENAEKRDDLSLRENQGEERRHGGRDQSNLGDKQEVVTRSGRTVKPSAVVRETLSGENKALTPVKRKRVGTGKRAKRSKFSYQTSSDETSGTSQNTLSQSSVNDTSVTEEGECLTETEMPTEEDLQIVSETDNSVLTRDDVNANTHAAVSNA